MPPTTIVQAVRSGKIGRVPYRLLYLCSMVTFVIYGPLSKTLFEGDMFVPGIVPNLFLIMPAKAVTVTATYKNSGGTSTGGSSYTNPDILRDVWIQTDTGIWMFRQTNGAYAKNCWGIVDGLWYYFDSEGRMLTGWQYLGGQWYYLHIQETAKTKTGMKEGAMASGWYFDPVFQQWFYFDLSGAMVTGWREIDGKWYYFNPEPDGQSGIMYTDDWIDGWYVDKNGVWDREAKKEK